MSFTYYNEKKRPYSLNSQETLPGDLQEHKKSNKKKTTHNTIKITEVYNGGLRHKELTTANLATAASSLGPIS